MAFFNLLWQIIAFIVMNIFEQVLNAADWIMFTIEDYEIYDNIVKFLSSCVSNYYFWQALATVGFCLYLRQLTNKFPHPSTAPISVGLVDVGPSMEQLLEKTEKLLKVAASKNNNLDEENAGLRTKVDYLQKELDFISKDRYALVREKFILQNKLGDYNSWPEFRVEYDKLATQYEVMKRQRAREHILQEEIMYIAKEAKFELAAVKRAEARGKIAQSEELKVVKQERDEAREKYQTLLTNTTTATATATTTAVATTTVTAVATTAAVERDTPGDKLLQEENTRLTLALRSKTSLLFKTTSDLERMKSLVKTRSDHSASQLQSATSTILTLKEQKTKAEEQIAELERCVRVANEKAEEMEEMYMAVAFSNEGEEEDEEKDEEKREDEEEEGSGEDIPESLWLLKQVVAMSKKGREEAGVTAGGSGVDEDERKREDGGGGGGGKGKNDEDEEEQEHKIHDENEDLFKDMMGRP